MGNLFSVLKGEVKVRLGTDLAGACVTFLTIWVTRQLERDTLL